MVLTFLLRRLLPPSVLLAFSNLLVSPETGWSQDSKASDKPLSAQEAEVASVAQEALIPQLIQWCGDCHQGDDPQSGIRIDRLGRIPRDREILLWEEFRNQIVQGKMPPEDAPQPDKQEIAEWLA
ncbi:MAG: c-type cytochrome domain-containing protein, partial [Pirellulaceae bacterium]